MNVERELTVPVLFLGQVTSPLVCAHVCVCVCVKWVFNVGLHPSLLLSPPARTLLTLPLSPPHIGEHREREREQGGGV